MSTAIENQRLWKRLDGHPDLQAAVSSLRRVAEAVAAKIAEVLPSFTDHSIVHMDALWRVTDKVFTEREIDTFTPGEAFVLACSFYTHDLGMAMGITEPGRQVLRQTSSFRASYDRLKQLAGVDEQFATNEALRAAARDEHANFAERLVDGSLPGLDRYLIDSPEVRRDWGAFVGQVAASHHWSLPKLDARLGHRGAVPDPLGSTVDLGLVACAIRIIDFAHINSARARVLDRILRSGISADSLRHWGAQENITGPNRDGAQLVYGSNRPIDTVDAWWTFYEMARGLDAEIRSVSEYLSQRTVSAGRFSLEGVRGTSSPQQFARLVQTSDFEPIDVRFKPESMERLIRLLGGRTLYGNDDFAPVRELMQNAADTIRVRRSDGPTKRSVPLGMTVVIEETDDGGTLSVIDEGAGMTETVVTNYLLGIASDYWNSPDFYSEHPHAVAAGFRPVGRFGIGFLSVFMLGDTVEVETQRPSGSALLLTLHGVGGRGYLRRGPMLQQGTTVRVQITRETVAKLRGIDRLVRSRVPMLDIPVTIRLSTGETVLQPGWWKELTQHQFLTYLAERRGEGRDSEVEREQRLMILRGMADFGVGERVDSMQRWPGIYPEIVADDMRIVAHPGGDNIVLCSKGFAVASVSMSGFVGLLEIGEADLNAARTAVLNWDGAAFKKRLLQSITPAIKEAFEGLAAEPSIPRRYSFLVSVAKTYGSDLLVSTNVPWVTLVEVPGAARLVSPVSLVEVLRRHEDLVVSFGNTNPWTVAHTASRMFPDAPKRAIMVPVSGVSQSDLRPGEGYDEKRKLLRAPLATHFMRNRRVERAMDVPLLRAVLSCIAAAWDIRLETLFEASWVSEGDVLCAHLTRARATPTS